MRSRVIIGLAIALLGGCASMDVDYAQLSYQEQACDWVAIEQEPAQAAYYRQLCKLGQRTRRELSK